MISQQLALGYQQGQFGSNQLIKIRHAVNLESDHKCYYIGLIWIMVLVWVCKLHYLELWDMKY